MCNQNTPCNIGIVYGIISRLNSEVKEGSISSAVKLGHFASELCGAPFDMVESIHVHQTSEVQGVRIELLSGHRVVIIAGAEINRDSGLITCGLPVNEHCIEDSTAFVGYVEQRIPGSCIFSGGSPNIESPSLVHGSLALVLACLRNHFERKAARRPLKTETGVLS